MTRAKTRRPGTRSDKSGRTQQAELPDAAEAALDDMLTVARSPGPDDRDDDDELATHAVPRQPPPRKSKARMAPPPSHTPAPGRTRVPAHGFETLDQTTTRAVPSLRTDESPSTLPRAETSAPLEVNQLVEERVLPELSALRVAIYEEAVHVASLQSAIGAAGHVVATAAAGRDGKQRVIDAVRASALDVVIVAIPGGEAIIDAALALEPRRPIVVASVDAAGVAAVERANGAGADLVAVRPHDVGSVAPVMLAAVRLTTERRIALAARGAEHVLRARLDELADPEPRGLLAFELFQRQLEMEIKRAKRFEYALSVALFAVEVAPPPPPPGIRGILRARAGNALIHTIRDIDIATQLDHERFLVLLPYTDLQGAAGVARRVLAAVAAGDPVVAAGRSFPPRIVGAVAGAQLGQPVSIARLIKEATRALEDARRDGADLAVQP